MGTGNGAEPSPLLAAQLGVSEDAVFRKWSWVSGRKLRVRRICAADPYAFHSTSSFFCMPSSVIPLFAGNTKNLATGCSVIIIEKKAESVARAFTEPHGGHGRQIASVCGGARPHKFGGPNHAQSSEESCVPRVHAKCLHWLPVRTTRRGSHLPQAELRERQRFSSVLHRMHTRTENMSAVRL